MTKSKLVGERLMETLKAHCDSCCDLDKYTCTMCEVAYTAILALFKSIMPEEINYTVSPEYCEGYADYRTELLKLLEEK